MSQETGQQSLGDVPDSGGTLTFDHPKMEDQGHGLRGFGHQTTY